MYLGEGQRWGPITYAQHGDDLFIINLFELMGIDKPSWLDVGANHPFAISNTALLYSRGSHGVNIEANPDLMPEFYQHRPLDKNINVGIAPEPGELDFYVFRDGNGLNTFDPGERDQTIASGNPVKEVRKVQCITLQQAVNTYCDGKWPNLLSMDIEGLDLEVLRTTLVGSEVICVETRKHLTAAMADAVGRYHSPIARLAENLIFIRDDLFSKAFGY